MIWVDGWDPPGKFQPKKFPAISTSLPQGPKTGQNRALLDRAFDDPTPPRTTTFLQKLKLLDRSMDLLETWTGCRGGMKAWREGVEILMTQRRHDVVTSRKIVLATVSVFFVRLP